MSESPIYRYAVLIKRKDGTEFVAQDNPMIPAFFWKRKDAVKYRDELKEQKLKCRVAKLFITFVEAS